MRQYRKIYKLKYYHFGIVLLTLALTLAGILLIGSARASVQNRQIAGLIAGLVIMVVVSLSDYTLIMNMGWMLYFINIVLLISVRVAGSVAGGAGRWLEIGGFRFQPSELSKLLVILFFAWFFEKYEDRQNEFRFRGIALLLIGLVCILILGQPDLSTTIVVFWIYINILFLSGVSYKILGKMFAGFGVCAAGAIFLVTRPNQQLLDNYQYERIMAWINPSEWSQEAYQQQNSMMAIGSGGFRGKGLNNNSPLSVKNGGFLPEPHTDFIMAVAGEELGYAGVLLIILLLLLIVLCCVVIGIRTKDVVGKMICGGVAAFIGGQAFINLCVVSGLMPNTGLTQPFVSYGLTSLLTCFAGIGLVLNVEINRKTALELKRRLKKGRNRVGRL